MSDTADRSNCQKGDHDLRWDDEHGRLMCSKCGMSSDAIMRQPTVSS